MSNATYWLFHRLTGLVLVLGMGVHFYVMHFTGSDTLTYQAVSERLNSTTWVAFNGILLISVIYHGFNGLWSLALEYIYSKEQLGFAKAILIFASFALVATGMYILAQ